jgi:hypothetical protein
MKTKGVDLADEWTLWIDSDINAIKDEKSFTKLVEFDTIAVSFDYKDFFFLY